MTAGPGRYGFAVDTGVIESSFGVAAVARRAEQAGYDAIRAGETRHDPFLTLTLAADVTQRIEVMSSVVVAFARNPMTVAASGWTLNEHSSGRFTLGLGSQVRAHIERRYSMPWSRPAARMREFVSAVRSIWHSWQTGETLDFRGEFYGHTLMTPAFDPGPSDHPAPAIFVAAVGPAMIDAATNVADGVILHPFTSGRYVRDVVAPRVEAGLAATGRQRSRFQISAPLLIASGETDEDLEHEVAAMRRQVAFYASTPTYRTVLELHGWEDLQTELHALSKSGAWATMARLVDDEVFDAFVVSGPPNTIASSIWTRLGGLVDRVSLGTPGTWSDDVVGELKERPAA